MTMTPDVQYALDCLESRVVQFEDHVRELGEQVDALGRAHTELRGQFNAVRETVGALAAELAGSFFPPSSASLAFLRRAATWAMTVAAQSQPAPAYDPSAQYRADNLQRADGGVLGEGMCPRCMQVVKHAGGYFLPHEAYPEWGGNQRVRCGGVGMRVP